MKAFLLYRDRDFDVQQSLPWNAQALTQDLELDTLTGAMAAGDEFLLRVAKVALLSSLDNEADIILYRQEVLKDCLKNPATIRDIYDIAVETIEREKHNYWGLLSKSPDAVLHRSVDVMPMFLAMLEKLRRVAADAGAFRSEGFRRFFAMLQSELDDAYFEEIRAHLRQLQFRGGVLISAELGKGNKGAHYVLRKPNETEGGWMQQVFAQKPPSYSFRLHPRDDNGARALGELSGQGVNLVANAAAQSNDHILSFFTLLRTEMAFYVGCLNLHERLSQKGEPTCFPLPLPADEHKHAFTGLYDVCLSLNLEQRVIGNDADAGGKDLVIITGANSGGKSTFLRSIGLAQLMMQCGMFAPAQASSANICDGLFTHYKREEDSSMESGKLDEELSRMSAIVDHLTPHALVLFNESFAATNEREGSEIARQIVRALLEKGVEVFFVTHLYDFAHGFAAKKKESVLFLRAERQPDGSRTFKLVEKEPLETSYGEDLYQEICAGETLERSSYGESSAGDDTRLEPSSG
jgi:DNA mismatch repair ATPase MutS